MGRKIQFDLSGLYFGSWSVIEYADHGHWKCLCKCGQISKVQGNALRNGKSLKCKFCSSKTHGMENTSTYVIWAGMKQRCMNPKAPSYKWYGALGVRVCDEWLIFENFLKDMGERPIGMSLDRIDSNKNYCKENCRWATSKQQIRNRRMTKMHSLNNESMALGDWADKYGINVRRVQQRLNAGWELRDAITKPIRKKGD